MFTTKEHKDYFISECKSRKYLMKSLNDCDDKLKYIGELLKDGYSDRNKAYILEEEITIKRREQIVDRINYVDDIIAKVREPQVRGMIVDFYVNDYSQTKVSRLYNVHRNTIHNNINSELKKIFKNS